MKIFDRFFFLGAIVSFIGLAMMFFGLILMLSGSWNILIGGAVVLVGAVASRYGRKLARNDLPDNSQTVIETLRRAKLIGGENKPKIKSRRR